MATWMTPWGPETVNEGQRVCLDDGTEGVVADVDVRHYRARGTRGYIPGIYVTGRHFPGGHEQGARWVQPCQIVG